MMQTYLKYHKEQLFMTVLSGCILVTILTLINDIIELIEGQFQMKLFGSVFISIYFCTLLLLIFFIWRLKKKYFLYWVFILFSYLGILYTSFVLGIQSGPTIILYLVLLIISGILINGKFAFILALIESVTIIVFSLLQYRTNYFSVAAYPPDINTTMFIITSLMIISIISWLHNNELKDALIKAKRSELELKKQKSLLEIKVYERTKELRKVEMEKLTQFYHFAEIGRISTGLFHDLVNPLNLISLNLEQLQEYSNQNEISGIRSNLKRALIGTKKLDLFISSFRTHINGQQMNRRFYINNEVKTVLEMLKHISQLNKVQLRFISKQNIILHGNPVKFNQVILNIIKNAVEAYTNVDKNSKREVLIIVSKLRQIITIKITDCAGGISSTNKKKIFEPFFSTKKQQTNSGIGLYMCKEIVTKYFHGTITFSENKERGTTFLISIPIVLSS